MIYGRRQQLSKLPGVPLSLMEKKLSPATVVIDLGVMFDLHGKQFHTTWPPRMQIVPPFGLFWIYKRCEELYKEKYWNFPNIVKNCPFAPQASISSHVLKSSSQKGCMNLSLNSVFSKYTANCDCPTPLELCPFSTTSAIYLFKNSTWLCIITGKKQVPSCPCLRSPNNKMSYIVLS